MARTDLAMLLPVRALALVLLCAFACVAVAQEEDGQTMMSFEGEYPI